MSEIEFDGVITGAESVERGHAFELTLKVDEGDEYLFEVTTLHAARKVLAATSRLRSWIDKHERRPVE